MIQQFIQWFRFSTIAWLAVIATAIYGLYTVKYRVLDLQREIASVKRELQQEQENLHVIAAEWAYLTRPDRLQALTAKNTELHPVQGIQVMEISALPFPAAEQNPIAKNSPKSGFIPTSSVAQSSAINKGE